MERGNMINWWIIIALLVVGLLLAKARHLKHKFWAVLIVLLLLFFYLTLPRVIEGKNIDVKTFDGMVMTGRLYFTWLQHSFVNVKDVTGYAVKMDWVGNKSNGSVP